MPNLAIGYYNQGYEKGFEEGFEKGFEEGFEEEFKKSFEKSYKEGKVLSLVSIINNLIDSGIPKDKAMALLKIDDDIKQEVLNKLNY